MVTNLIQLWYVNNYDKNRYLGIFSKATVDKLKYDLHLAQNLHFKTKYCQIHYESTLSHLLTNKTQGGPLLTIVIFQRPVLSLLNNS